MISHLGTVRRVKPPRLRENDASAILVARHYSLMFSQLYTLLELLFIFVKHYVLTGGALKPTYFDNL